MADTHQSDGTLSSAMAKDGHSALFPSADSSKREVIKSHPPEVQGSREHMAATSQNIGAPAQAQGSQDSIGKPLASDAGAVAGSGAGAGGSGSHGNLDAHRCGDGDDLIPEASPAGRAPASKGAF